MSGILCRGLPTFRISLIAFSVVLRSLAEVVISWSRVLRVTGHTAAVNTAVAQGRRAETQDFTASSTYHRLKQALMLADDQSMATGPVMVSASISVRSSTRP